MERHNLLLGLYDHQYIAIADGLNDKKVRFNRDHLCWHILSSNARDGVELGQKRWDLE